MHRQVSRQGICPLCLLCACLAFTLASIPSAADPTRGAPRIDQQTAHDAARYLWSVLERAVRDAGGDLERQHVHLVLAFSTGHFATDPVRAQAAREIGASLLRTFLVPGDRLSVHAWEMHLWAAPGAPSEPMELPGDASKRAALISTFPLTPQARSVGGHDTERAITEIADKLANDSDAAIVLLANDAASVSPPGGSVMGEDDPAYQRVLSRWRRLPAVGRSGASAILRFAAITPQGIRIQRSLDAVILVPTAFAGTPIAGGTRTAAAPAEVPVKPSSATPVVQARKLPYWPICAVVALIVAVVLFLAGRAIRPLLFHSRRRPVVLHIGDADFVVTDVPLGEEVCHVAGHGYPGGNAHTIYWENAPPERLVRVMRERGGVLVRGDAAKPHSLDGVVVVGDQLLTPDGRKHTLVFHGEYTEGAGLPPRHFEVTVPVEVSRQDEVRKGGETP